MRKSVCILFLFIAFGLKAQEVVPSFSEDIAPIIYNKCSSCHHIGGIGPMSFCSYEEVKKNASMIYMAAVDQKFMPPWMPDTKYSHFLDERRITEEEAKAINDWVNKGMLEGPKA